MPNVRKTHARQYLAPKYRVIRIRLDCRQVLFGRGEHSLPHEMVCQSPPEYEEGTGNHSPLSQKNIGWKAAGAENSSAQKLLRQPQSPKGRFVLRE
jgi:hypothetical protein